MQGLYFFILASLLLNVCKNEGDGTYYLFPTTPYVIELNDPNEEVKLTRDATGNVEIAHKDAYGNAWKEGGQIETIMPNPNPERYYGNREENYGSGNIETVGKWIFNENMKPAYAPSPAEIMNSVQNKYPGDYMKMASNEYNKGQMNPYNEPWRSQNQVNEYNKVQMNPYNEPWRSQNQVNLSPPTFAPTSGKYDYSPLNLPTPIYTYQGSSPNKDAMGTPPVGNNATDMTNQGSTMTNPATNEGAGGGGGGAMKSDTKKGKKDSKNKNKNKDKSSSSKGSKAKDSYNKNKKKSAANGIQTFGLITSILSVIIGCCLFQV